MLRIERLKFIFYYTCLLLIWPYFFLRSRRKAVKNIKFETARILVVPIMTRLGDMVCSTPVFRAIKIAYPNCHLSVASGKKIIGIIENNNRIDRIININHTPFKGFWGRGRFFQYIHKQNFDVVISLTNNPFNNLVALASAAPLRIKTISSSRSVSEYLTDWINNHKLVFKNHTLLQKQYVNLLKFIGINKAEIVKEVFESKGGPSKAREFMERHEIQDGDFVLGMSITAGNRVKEWGDDKFREIAQKAISTYGAKVVITGSLEDHSRVESVVDSVGESCYTACEFSHADLPSLIKRFSLFVAVDTGPIYVAHALKVPLVDIVGPVDPREQPPSDSLSVLVLPPRSIPPSAFVMKSMGSPEEHMRAIDATTVDMVWDSINRQIAALKGSFETKHE